MLRSARNYGGRAYSAQFALICKDESRTKQSEANDADINVIVGRFLKSGVIPQVTAPPSFQDFEDVFDFQSAMNTLAAAKVAFAAMDAPVRKRFGNDPSEFVDFVEKRAPDGSRENLAELRKMGIVLPEVIAEEPKPMRVEVVNGKPTEANGGDD